MGESLGSRPEELYAEHKSNAERLDEMQRRLDAAIVLSDILTPDQISQLGSAHFDAKMQYENNLRVAAKHYKDEDNSEAYTKDASEVEEERANYKSPEQQIAELEQQIEDMRQWLIQDRTYSQAEVDNIIQSLSVEYNQDKQQAEVVGDLNLRRLTSAKDLVLPQSIGGTLWLNKLTSAKGLVLPQSIGGGLGLYSLTSAEGLVLPQSIGGGLDLDGLTSAKDLELPQSIGGNLRLSSLRSAEGLELPQSIGGFLDLNRLTSAEDLELPQSIGGNLYLRSLTSAEDLELPQSIGGGLDLFRLTSAEREQIRAQRPDLAGRIYPKD